MDVFDAMSLWVFYRYKSMLWCLSLCMDLQAMSINVYGFAGLVYGCYKKGRNLWCYWCYVNYIHLDSYVFFSWWSFHHSSTFDQPCISCTPCEVVPSLQPLTGTIFLAMIAPTANATIPYNYWHCRWVFIILLVLQQNAHSWDLWSILGKLLII